MHQRRSIQFSWDLSPRADTQRDALFRGSPGMQQRRSGKSSPRAGTGRDGQMRRSGKHQRCTIQFSGKSPRAGTERDGLFRGSSRMQTQRSIQLSGEWNDRRVLTLAGRPAPVCSSDAQCNSPGSCRRARTERDGQMRRSGKHQRCTIQFSGKSSPSADARGPSGTMLNSHRTDPINYH
jgi:hypothetical protein